MYQNLNIWDVLDELGTDETFIGRWLVEVGLQVLLGPWLMQGVCSLSVVGLT